MSPKQSDSSTARNLIDVAARLLSTDGPQALTTRRLAAEVGSSTMVVYTHFGGMSGLIREVVREGFHRLQEHLTKVEFTDDPVADTALLGRAYRHNALLNPHLYAIMFGAASLGGFSLSEEDRQHGRYTLGHVIESVGRCVSAGRFRPGQPELIAHQMWIASHGLTTLELGDYLVDPHDADRCFEEQLTGLMAGAGDDLADAVRSVATSRSRFHLLFPDSALAAR